MNRQRTAPEPAARLPIAQDTPPSPSPATSLACLYAAQQTTKRAHIPESAYIPALTQREQIYVRDVIFIFVVNDLKNWKDTSDGGLSRKRFHALGPEAIPLLAEWMNYCTARGWTCPCTHIAKKLEHFLDYASRKMDIDTLEFMEQRLASKIPGKESPQPLTGLRALAIGGRKSAFAEKSHHVKRLDFDSLIQLATGGKINHEALANTNFDTSAKLADWRIVIETIATKKEKEAAFDLLLTQMGKANTPRQRKTLHEALKTWSGTDKGPAGYESDKASLAAIEQWRAWRMASAPASSTSKKP